MPQVYTNTRARASAPSRFFVLDAEDFAQLMREWFPMAVHLLEGLFFGPAEHRSRLTGQRERLLALGSLSAGLTHELNNPAAAAVRATADPARAGRGDAAQARLDRRRAAATGRRSSTLIQLQEEAVDAGGQGAAR